MCLAAARQPEGEEIIAPLDEPAFAQRRQLREEARRARKRETP
jgi:hypothetical protein